MTEVPARCVWCDSFQERWRPTVNRRVTEDRDREDAAKNEAPTSVRFRERENDDGQRENREHSGESAKNGAHASRGGFFGHAMRIVI